jgi:hypothetical protein
MAMTTIAEKDQKIEELVRRIDKLILDGRINNAKTDD